jgi:ribosomal protein S17E
LLAQGVRTKTVKRAARVIIEKYYPRMTLDFQTNKRVCEEVAMIPTKALKNKIAGYATVSFCTRPANLLSPGAGASLLLRCRAHHIVRPLRFGPLRLDARRARLSTDRVPCPSAFRDRST